MNNPTRNFRRERVLIIAFVALVITFGARLVQLQIFQHDQWRQIGQNQCHLTKLQKPTRGEIRDCQGVPLAVTLPLTYAVGYRPVGAADRDRLATQLAPVLSLPRREIRTKLDSPSFTYIARKVDWEQKQRIERLGLTCLQFDEEPRRSYPSKTTAAALLGFTNREGEGVEGIEAYLNDELSGEAFRELCRVDALRKAPAPVSPTTVQLKGADVTLTIDVQLQSIIEDGLRSGLADKRYERACAILVEPKTGDILALSTLPTFDPNSPGDAKSEQRRCWPVTDVYEPGSTLKIVAATQAIESGKYTRSSQIFCENGSYRVPGTIIHDSHPYGRLSLADVIAFSSNIGAAKISSTFTPSEVYDKLRAFGFGNLTLVGIAGEQPGQVPPPSQWSGPTQATMAFGQGISCTALQLVMAYAAVANGGTLMKPRLVQSVEFPSGHREDSAPESIRRVMSSQVAAELTNLLVGAVEHGTGTATRIEGLHIAGKTGTAEKVDYARRTYFADKYVASFAGFFPAEHPEYCMLIIVDDPQGQYYGGSVAAPIFRQIVEQIIQARPHEFPSSLSPDQRMTQTPRRAEGEVQLATMSGPVTTAALVCFKKEGVQDSVMIPMPAVEGLSTREAIGILSRSGVGFRLHGVRRVTKQMPAAGAPVLRGAICELYCEAE